MIVNEIAFVRPVPVLGSYKTEARFSAEEGWRIEVHDYGVTLSKAEQQNVPEVPAFCVCGVGYSVTEAAVSGAPVIPVEMYDVLSEEGKAALAAGDEPTARGLISEATLGNTETTAEQLLASGAAAALHPDAVAATHHRRGRRGPR